MQITPLVSFIMNSLKCIALSRYYSMGQQNIVKKLSFSTLLHSQGATFITKSEKCCYKVAQVLQSIKKCDKILLKSGKSTINFQADFPLTLA